MDNSAAMWKIIWMDKAGKEQTAIVDNKTKAEEIMDNLTRAGIVGIQLFLI